MIDHLSGHPFVDADVFPGDKSGLVGAEKEDHVGNIQRITDTRKARRLETEPAIREACWSWLETLKPSGQSGDLCEKPKAHIWRTTCWMGVALYRTISQKISPVPMR